MAKISGYVVAMLLISSITLSGFSQSLKVGGQLGYCMPQGELFTSQTGEKLSGGGLSLGVDAIYFPKQLEPKLGFGLDYNGSILFGKEGTSVLDVGLYSLSMYGAKIYYQFLDKKVTPFVSLSMGLAQLATPEISDGSGNVIADPEKSSSFGFRPEVGFDLGGFILSVGYIVPMQYGEVGKKAGVVQCSLGYRRKTF